MKNMYEKSTKQLPLSDATIVKIAHINSLQANYSRIEAQHQSHTALKILGRVFAIADRNHDKRSKERLLDRITEIKAREWMNDD
ncbi:hypothetical protein [Lentilactobacillus hilgardii]|jgi:hypothetical protein|uniref:hypothetical protein n=1 Tax=Lentilactobacillus hilgardii TaxID=1588 RepID=UPI0021C26C33|nr:hypothetical protein [Lentilactobacillus hilgardii]MCI1922826.1 hypothetical protein [Lentilactobacillus buchneri]MCI1950436.1 hypothetical protein [Lentilactobacillus buchneri]MCI2018585.1 hypothetical protein [Lentilactobacillus buchneri]MCI2027604.1 hypothetical protein [Lentilactobacillus buchneri]MCP9331895.1 hypothetical protein [Lentilactobacillus hilgardii]